MSETGRIFAAVAGFVLIVICGALLLKVIRLARSSTKAAERAEPVNLAGVYKAAGLAGGIAIGTIAVGVMLLFLGIHGPLS